MCRLLQADREALAAGGGDPLAFKHALASRIVERFHGADGAAAGAAHFRKVVQRRELPDDIPTEQFSLGGDGRLGLLEIIEGLGFAKSKSEARRLIAQGGVKLDGEGVDDPTVYIGSGSYLIEGGKRRDARIELAG